MKRFAAFLSLLLFSLAAHAGHFTMDEILIKKLVQPGDDYDAVLVMGFLSDRAYCLQTGCGIEIEDFSVARQFEDMQMGLYRCKGDFVHTRGRRTIQIFKVRSCTPVNEDDLKKQCPAKS